MNRATSILSGLLLTLLPLAAQDDNTPPPTARLEPVRLEALSSQDIPERVRTVLARHPKRWRHAETQHFIYHYRRSGDARRVVREIEFNLWFVGRALQAPEGAFQQKSHVVIFADDDEWKIFLAAHHLPGWSASLAIGPTLYLKLRSETEGFDSQLLAHESAHAIVARLYPGRPWPLWLNEGFAEYMGSACVAARQKRRLHLVQRKLDAADLPLEELLALKTYPETPNDISRLYQSSERLVRFLMTAFPKERFVPFVEEIIGGATIERAVDAIYGDLTPDFQSFSRRYADFE